MTTDVKGFIHHSFYQSSDYDDYEGTLDQNAFDEEQDGEIFTYFRNPETGRLDFMVKPPKKREPKIGT